MSGRPIKRTLRGLVGVGVSPYASPLQYDTKVVDSTRALKHIQMVIGTRESPEYVEHYHRERNHQGRNNQLLARAPPPARVRLEIRRREHLGGLLNYYYREAA